MMPTANVMANAINISLKGRTKLVFMARDTILPKSIPMKMPMIPPIWPIITASIRNCKVTLREFAPMALRVPISRAFRYGYEHYVHKGYRGAEYRYESYDKGGYFEL